MNSACHHHGLEFVSEYDGGMRLAGSGRRTPSRLLKFVQSGTVGSNGYGGVHVIDCEEYNGDRNIRATRPTVTDSSGDCELVFVSISSHHKFCRHAHSIDLF